MYKPIYDYAVKHNLSLPKHRKKKKVEAYVMLDSSGKYEGIATVEKPERVWCPHIADNAPTIICEKVMFIMPSDEATEKTWKRYDGWMALMKEGAQNSETLHSIYTFLHDIDEDKNFRDTVRKDLCDAKVKDSSYVSFRIDSVNAEKAEDWVEWFDRYAGKEAPANSAAQEAVSCLTGDTIEPIKAKFPKNRSKIAGTSVPLYSNQHHSVSGIPCSFVSYGCIEGIGCPMSKEEADAVNAGLTHLLDSEINNDRNFQFIYWYDRDDAIDLITRVRTGRRCSKPKDANEVEAAQDEQYKTVLDAVFEGTKPENIKDGGKYHIVEYSVPDKGRFSLSRDYTGTYEELYESLQRWYKDSTLINAVWVNKKNTGNAVYTLRNINAVLFQCLQRKGTKKFASSELQKKSDIEFGEDKRNLIRAVIFGKKIPQVYLRNASAQVTRHYVCNELFKEEGRTKRILLQVIKASLIREGYKDMDVKLNRDSTSVGYQCGRWFATVVRCQELASEKALNVTMAERYYRAVKQSPARTLAMVNDLKEHYLGRTKRSRVYLEKLFAEIAGHIGDTFPEKLSILEQGAFDLGYAQQRQAFFEHVDTKNDTEADTDTDESGEDEA